MNSAAAAFQESWDQVSEEDAENMVAIDQKKPAAAIEVSAYADVVVVPWTKRLDLEAT